MAQAQAYVPFQAAAHRHSEGPFFTATFTPGAATVNLLTGAAANVPSYGFMRSICLLITATGGVAGTLAADGPFNVLSQVSLQDVNGAPIFGGPTTTSFDLFLANLFGGYVFFPDIRNAVDFVGVTPNFAMMLRIPVECDAYSGMCSLPNMNAAAPFRLSLVGNTLGAIWSTAPTTVPLVTVTGFLEAWTLPNPQDLAGRPQQQYPIGAGSTQYWSRQDVSIAAGANTVRLTRVGNLLRTLILIYRDNSGVRTTIGNWPNPLTYAWDARNLRVESPIYRRYRMKESVTQFAAPFPDGVLAYSYAAPKGQIFGGDGPENWLPTVQSTRLEFAGTFGVAGTLSILTNDIAPVEAAMPYEFGSQSGMLLGPAQPSTAA